MSIWAKIKLKRAAWWNQKDEIERGDFWVRTSFALAIGFFLVGVYLVFAGALIPGAVLIVLSLSAILAAAIAS